MKVRSYIVILILGCSAGGLSLFALVSVTSQKLEKQHTLIGEDALTLNDWGRFQEAFDQWLVLSDLILGSDVTYLDDGAIQLSQSLRNLISKMLQTRLGARQSEPLKTLHQFVVQQTDRLAQASRLGSDNRSDILNQLLKDMDEASSEVLARLDNIHQNMLDRSQQNRAEFDRAVARRDAMIWTVAGLYLLWVGILWGWTTRTISHPLQRLSREAQLAYQEEREVQLPRAGPKETLLLSDILSKLIGSLEVRVNERTSELAELNTDLTKSVQEAQAADTAKSAFLANMSHEIRTPMTAILGYTTILADQAKDAQQLDSISTIDRNGQHLLAIINDILDISKLQAKQMQIEKLNASPFQIAQEVLELLQVRAKEKSITIDMQIAGPVPQSIETDPIRLKQILLNLVGNAIKFTESGSVQLRMNLPKPLSSEDQLIKFEIVDSGIGITDDQASQLFQAFHQADSSVARRFGGTGLGLAISKQLSELLGGTIEVHSQLGHGSTFTVTVATGSLDGVKLLDSLDGLAATQRQNSNRDSVELHACDANNTLADVNILLAEDGRDNQRIITYLLKKAKSQVTVVENGRLAVEAVLAATNQNQPFDVILMDMQMPIMGGYEATSILREKGYQGTIVALTAHAMTGDREKCIQAGCDEYLTKPVNRDKLIGTIYQLTMSRRSAA